MMKFGSSAQMSYGITPATSVSVGERLAFIKKVYGLLALSLVTAAIGAHLGSDPELLLIPVASNMISDYFLSCSENVLVFTVAGTKNKDLATSSCLSLVNKRF